MRNLKRALSLALAAVMVLGMMVVGASAASYDDFSDKDEIVNKEAVSVLVELGVIAGKDDGTYDPTGIITRAEMAKLICTVLNGGKDPNLGNVVTYTYADTVGHWAAPYIEYCTQLGIVAGDGAGNFNPNATVTGSEAAKMLLVATGYNAQIEGYVGANWEVTTNVRANMIGLYDGLTLNPSEGLTRDAAAQMVYNDLDALVVTYKYTLGTDGSSITTYPELVETNSAGQRAAVLARRCPLPGDHFSSKGRYRLPPNRAGGAAPAAEVLGVSGSFLQSTAIPKSTKVDFNVSIGRQMFPKSLARLFACFAVKGGKRLCCQAF